MNEKDLEKLLNISFKDSKLEININHDRTELFKMISENKEVCFDNLIKKEDDFKIVITKEQIWLELTKVDGTIVKKHAFLQGKSNIVCRTFYLANITEEK